MQYRNLGDAGLKVSELCLGTMQFGWTADEKTSFEVMTAAFEAGINFLDTADIYSSWVEGNPGGVSEIIIGRWLKTGVAKRDQIVIATKVRGHMGDGPNDEGLSRRHILQAAHASLRRMNTDYIDLYQVHWPDESTPIDETLSALDDLVRQGFVRYIGCSNFAAWRLMQALWTSDQRGLHRFRSLQPHYNVLHREEYERELEDVCQTYGLGVLPYSPLAAGFLTGKYQRGDSPQPDSRGAVNKHLRKYLLDERSWDILNVLIRVSAEEGKTVSQIALGWLLSRPTVTSPIIGPRDVRQLEDNLGAVGLHLDDQDLSEINNATAWKKA